MIFEDAQKYFSKARKGQWSAITRDMNSFLKEKGINFYGLVDHYKKTNSKKRIGSPLRDIFGSESLTIP